MWRLEDSLQELIISFYHVGFGTENEVGTLDNKHLCFLQPSSGTLMDTVAGYKNLRLFSVDFTLQILRLGETNQMFFIVGMIKMLFYD